MTYTDNPIKDFYAWDYEQQKSPDREIGECEFCSEPVLLSESYYVGADKKVAHRECVHKAEERIINYI